MTFRERRDFLRLAGASALGLGAGGLPRLARAATREETIAAAKQESGLVWYDHYDHDAAENILAAFRRAYPFVKSAEFVDVPSAQKTARIIQESMAGGPTADVLLNDASVEKSLFDRGLLVETDWTAFGMKASPETTPAPYMMVALTPAYVLIHNTSLVGEADAPKTWDDAFDARWKGKTGHWMRAAFFVGLIPALGEAKVRDMVARLAALRPRMFDGWFPVAQAIGAGEIAMSVCSLDSAIRIIEKGAPVKMFGPDPGTFGLICGSALKYGKNPNTARLFLAWLGSPEGAVVFENETKRGNAFVPGTHAATTMEGRKLSYFTAEQSIAQAKRLNALEAEFSRQLAGR